MTEKKNSIAIFKNENKKQEKSPDLTGLLEIDGVKYQASLWKSKSKAGKAYYSGSVQIKLEKPKQITNAKELKQAWDNLDEGVPF